MATYTENYNLELPEEDDIYDISVFNENMEAVDTLLAETEQNIGNLGEQMETATNEIKDGIETINQNIGATGDETVFDVLNQISTAIGDLKLIKSIQCVDYTTEKTSSGSVSINSVTPSKCVVLMTRLQDTASNGITKMNYTLNATSISCTHGNANTIIVKFWIIEFY